MDRRRASLGIGLLLLVALAWWVLRPPVPAPECAPSAAAVPTPPHAVPRAVPVAVDAEELPPMDPPPDVRRQRAALDLVAEASGLYMVDCPKPELQDGGGFSFPGWWVVRSATGWAFTTDQPEGVIALRSGSDDGTVIGVLHWSRGPDGETSCVEEPVDEHHVPVRVVDREGQPVPKAMVQVENGGFQGPAGPDGMIDVVLQADAPASVQAFGEIAFSDVEWIDPGDHPTLRLTLGGDTEEESLATARAMVAERVAGKRRAIAATLARKDVPGDLVEVLEQWDREIPQATQDDGDPADGL